MFKKSDWKPLILGCVVGMLLFFGTTVKADDTTEQFEPVDIPEEKITVQTWKGPVDMTEDQMYWFIEGARTGYLVAEEFVLDICLTTEGNVLVIAINGAKYSIQCRSGKPT